MNATEVMNTPFNTFPITSSTAHRELRLQPRRITASTYTVVTTHVGNLLPPPPLYDPESTTSRTTPPPSSSNKRFQLRPQTKLGSVPPFKPMMMMAPSKPKQQQQRSRSPLPPCAIDPTSIGKLADRLADNARLAGDYRSISPPPQRMARRSSRAA
mmetsp:Transcript_51463/g.76816  ORF Transcript_51463/g.76816 Transcript_51463/m.76816 type:complete len:156 (-) Transcript_51463:122-589(-)|eukprot:CAMPEP_0194047416 /NCGR_PEP_ID=MMETSP0009_2-20130614/24572_1 /TAXON_ID=210454 /ORGANISM="Grammatophora oceanica, Strain CCMP 410" /LENGTH=155 /DNA_ID=CAMNT_0038693035 /DNA_START=133 /DNA_END=600 /DNA_ORIENTATION=+